LQRAGRTAQIETGTPGLSGTTVDDFDDGDTSGWSPSPALTSTFEASQDRASSGVWSARYAEGSAREITEWQNVGTEVAPTTVETAHALENGEIYADSSTEWRLGETTVLRINYNWSNNFLAVNGTGANASTNSGAVIADLPWPSSETFFHVVLADIDWDTNVVGEVRMNGSVQAEDVSFLNTAESIDRTAVFIGGNGGNEMFIDDTTVPTEESYSNN